MRSTAVIASLIAVTLSGAGCYKLQPVSLQRLTVREPPAVWVTTADFTVLVLEKPRVFGDTLVGQVGGQYTELPPGEWQTIRMRTRDKAKTLALVGGTALGIGMAALLFSGSGASVTPDSNISCTEFPSDPNCQ
jgi:hypothetical protein